MKIMSRSFNRSERALLLFLAIVLLGLVYYWFVDQPVRSAISQAKTESDELWIEIQSLQEDIERYEKMKAELEAIGSDDGISYMASYNNTENELRELNDILVDTVEYTINFSNVTRNGDQIRRNFNLNFKTVDYSTAKKIIEQLENCRDRCLVGDVKCTVNREMVVTVTASATFYETMVGGTPDSGLPEDQSKGTG